MSSTSVKGKDVKKRNWCAVGYPESLPEDWYDVLVKTGLQGCVSPLHNMDSNPDGEVKKEHYHFIFCYSGPTSYNVVKRLTDSLNMTIPQPLEQVRGYYRYFTHKDNPEKYQYDEKDIRVFGGFNILDFVERTRSEVQQIKRDIYLFIRKNDVVNYMDLLNKLYDLDLSDMFEISTDHAYTINSMLMSNWQLYRRKKGDALADFILDPVVHPIEEDPNCPFEGQQLSIENPGE